jgi:hypothetical protein
LNKKEQNNIQAKKRQEIEKNLDDLTLMDDDLMSKVFDGNIEATELLLKIILERDNIKVSSVKGQVEMKNHLYGGRTITVDIHAIDDKRKNINVEVQRSTSGSHVRRARFHGSMMDSRMLHERDEFKDLKDSYVIFICEHDKFGLGKPIYHVERYVQETGEPFGDGSYIIYVNGEYDADDDIGHLIKDLKCKEAKDMYYPELANGVSYFKETEEGREIMCDAFKSLADKWAKEAAEEARTEGRVEGRMEGRVEGRTELVQSLMDELKISLEKALDMLKISGKEREIIIAKLR